MTAEYRTVIHIQREKSPNPGQSGRRARINRRARATSVAVIAAAGALVASANTGSAAVNAPKTTQVTCTLNAYNVNFPQTTGLSYGDLKCSQPFGDGVQRAPFTLAFPTPGTVTSNGTFTNYGARGTTYGSSSLSGRLGVTATTLHGTFKILGGTGAYRHAHGAGKLTCTTTNAAKTYTCTITATLTGI